MKKKHTRIQLVGVVAVAAAMITVSNIGYYNELLDNFSNDGSSKQTDIGNRMNTSVCFLESMTTYGEKFFKNGGMRDGSEYFDFLRYDSASDSYSMDNMEGTVYEKLIGNLTGNGKIPNSEIDRKEINMALCLNDYFSHFSEKMPEIAWIYYASEQGFINMYPWISSKDFKYTDDLKTVDFYSVANPENDPSRQLVWTPVYMDAAGKGLMITLSSPIYNGEVFKGVLSLDFTTEVLSGFLQSDYDSYIVDDDCNVISESYPLGTNISISKLKELLQISDKDFQELKDAEYEKVQTAGSLLIYKAKISDTPFSLIMVVPEAKIFWKAIYMTLPEIVIGILLLFSFFVLINLRNAEKMLRNASLTDPLTGLNNRRFLDAIIKKEMARADRYKETFSMVSLDLDRFKKVNDTWGHPIGDEVLKLTASIVRNSIRESDVFIRLGGEEFAILLPQTGIDAAYMIADKARKAIEEASHPIAGKFTASFGVAERQSGESYNSLYRRVDEALYSAKVSGRNCVIAYEEKTAKLAVAIKIEWNPSWECGEAKIDMQHRKLLELGNTLFGMAQAKPENFNDQLEVLINHIVEHFEYEECVQTEIGYPDAENHAELHRKLTEKALQIKEASLAGQMKTSAMISFVMDDVIIGHLLEEDTKFFPYVKQIPK